MSWCKILGRQHLLTVELSIYLPSVSILSIFCDSHLNDFVFISTASFHVSQSLYPVTIYLVKLCCTVFKLQHYTWQIIIKWSKITVYVWACVLSREEYLLSDVVFQRVRRSRPVENRCNRIRQVSFYHWLTCRVSFFNVSPSRILAWCSACKYTLCLAAVYHVFGIS